ncbi:MAG: hypothetical protein IIT46_08990 [Lachnospiraceae bacterium]|nr:hypothetical protein [Lachnospiraceae bacterium]
MKKKMLLTMLCVMSVGMISCGKESNQTDAQPTEILSTNETKQQDESKTEALTEEQALEAIKNYCFVQNPDLKDMVDSEEYTINWDVSTNDKDEIVVLYRSYTGSETRYYIAPVSGETHVTEMVPGVTDEEQDTDESFNVRDYLQ